MLPVAPGGGAGRESDGRRVASSAAGRRLVFGWFVGMARPQAVDARMGAELIRGAADASPVVADVLEALQGLRLADPAAELRVPALVIWGDLDVHADNGYRLAAALSGSTHVLAGCGHMPMLEAPTASAAPSTAGSSSNSRATIP